MLSTSLQSETDRCVMCGMCSQHCPTYDLTPVESESPRGRIALISALNQGRLSLNENLQAHLNHCTGCRACEDSCPSQVRFGAIMDEARALITAQQSPNRWQQRLYATLTHAQQLGKWLDRYQRWGLQKFARASGILKLMGVAPLEHLLPSTSQPELPQHYSPSIGQHRGDVALFTGCVSRLVDREALDASRRLLNLLGYGVHIPQNQNCCGALHLHNGQPERARQLALENIQVFSPLNVEAIVHTASGCTAQLMEYPEVPGLTTEQQTAAQVVARKVKDINQFLNEVNWPEDLQPHAYPHPIAIHEPCSLRNVLHQAQAPYQVLRRIPEIMLEPLPHNNRCCGAGGSLMLTQRELAQKLRQPKLEALAKLRPQILVTSNIGCALHLSEGLRHQGLAIEVIHPVSLLARQLAGQLKSNTSKPCTTKPSSAKVAS